jgi:hypothetical protein
MPEGRRTSRATGPRGRSSDHLPALSADDRGGVPLDRRSAQKHPLIALILLSGAAAALMWGALDGALGTRAHFALAPPIFRRAEANASSRGNQLIADSLGTASRLLRTRVEEIDEQAKTNKVFTHIVAHLEGSSDPPALAEATTTISAKRVSATAGAQTLPSEILTGLSQAEAQVPAAARAYADVEAPEMLSQAPLGRPLNLTTVARSQSDIVNERRVVFARPGDTLRQVLSDAGMIAQDAQAVSPLLSLDPSGSDALTADDSVILTVGDSNEQPFRPLKSSPNARDIPHKAWHLPTTAVTSGSQPRNARTTRRSPPPLKWTALPCARRTIGACAKVWMPWRAVAGLIAR